MTSSNNQFHISIRNIDKTFYDGFVDAAGLPRLNGEVTILPDHIKYACVLEAGIIKLYEGNKITKEINVTRGYAAFDENKCIVSLF